MSGLPVRPPAQGLCQPPDGGKGLYGLSDLEVRSLAAWLKLHHPESFECALEHISQERALSQS